MTVPAEYNAVSLIISPTEIYDAGLNVQTAAEDVINALKTINDTLDALQLGWDGTTAAEAKDFSDQWTAAMTNLFGDDSKGKGASTTTTTGTAGMGVLSQVIETLLTAGGNYGSAEGNVTSMFTSLSSGLSVAGGGSDDTAPMPPGSPVSDGTLSSVGEINWTALP